MLYKSLADVVLLAHLGFVAFVVIGGAAVLRWPRLAWVHLPAVIWAVLIEYVGWICPLTPLENALRQAGGEALHRYREMTRVSSRKTDRPIPPPLDNLGVLARVMDALAPLGGSAAPDTRCAL